MPSRSYDIENEDGLAGFAARLAPVLKTGDVVALRGGLGAGKTALSRALVNARAAAPEEVPSPTFTLVQVYDLPDISVWHFDLYRLEGNEADILELGWEDARRFGLSLVEWPARLGGLLPPDRLEIGIDFIEGSDTARRITLHAEGPAWAERLKGI